MEIISIVTPSYNQGAFLEDTIRSVLEQEGSFYIDYIIMDGGSTDDSVAVIKRFEALLAENCDRVVRSDMTFYVKKNPAFGLCNCAGISYRWVSEKDRGQSHAINKGLRLIRGNFFAWINSDDYYTGRSVFSSALEFFRSDPECGMIYGRGSCVDEHRNVTRDFHDNCTTLSFSRRILKYECFILQPAVFIRSGVVAETGPVDESLHWCMDWDYWLRIARKHTIRFFPFRAANWRQHQAIKTFSLTHEMFSEMDAVVRKYSDSLFEYMMSRWYYQGLRENHIRHLISLRYRYKIQKILAYGAELFIQYALTLLVTLFRIADRRPGELHLALFAPLEPLQSGAAPLNTTILKGLITLIPDAFIDVYIDGGYSPSVEAPRLRVIDHSLFSRNANIYDAVVFQDGRGAPEYGYLARYIRGLRGIAALNDNAGVKRLHRRINAGKAGNSKSQKLAQCITVFASYPDLHFKMRIS